MAKNASAQEVAAARAFLKFLGRDWRNNALVLAVVVWARVASGRLSGSLGSNPFRLYKLKDGNYVTAAHRGSGAKLQSFSTLTQAFLAAARALKYMAKTFKKNGYNDILISLKSGDAGEVLTAVAVSDWDKRNYGLRVEGNKWVGTNKLISVFNTYDGLITPEAAAAAAAEKARQEAEQRRWEAQERARKAALAKFKRRPKQLNPPVIVRDYTDPHAVGRLYAAKHPPYELPE